jgi:hypothetical protein
MKLLTFSDFLNEERLQFQHSDAPDAEGRFSKLPPKKLAAWLIKTRNRDLRKITGSLNQQINFNRKKNPDYAAKMEKTREEVYRQLKRNDLLEDSRRFMTTTEIIDYITNITPDHSDVPDYFFKLMREANLKYELKRVDIREGMKNDSSLSEYIQSGEMRYQDDDELEEPHPDELNHPIVIFQDEVVDGYSRCATHYHSGDYMISAYVSF